MRRRPKRPEMDPALRNQLRSEATAVKDCFTRFSFQALALSGVGFGAVAAYQTEQPLVGLIGAAVIILVLTVSRIGAYKYATANRHFAFELFCDTLATRRELGVRWEEALRAWRIVQATLFEEIYITRDDFAYWDPRRYFKYNNVQRENLTFCDTHGTWWFNAKEQVARSRSAEQVVGDDRRSEPKWYPGNYLRTMQWILHLVAGLALVPLLTMAIQLRASKFNYLDLAVRVSVQSTAWVVAVGVAMLAFYRLGRADGGWLLGSLGLVPLVLMVGQSLIPGYALSDVALAVWTVEAHWIGLAVFGVALFGVWHRTLQMRARRELLEHGLLSIATSAVVWQIVLRAHHRALDRSHGLASRYLPELGAVAADVAAHAGCIWHWLEGGGRSSASGTLGQETPDLAHVS